MCRNHWLNSRRQLFNRFAYGLTELIHSSSVHPPFECIAYIHAGPAEFDVVLFVEHRVLTHVNTEHPVAGEEKPTLIIVRRILTEPKATLAGVKAVASFARFRTAIDALIEVRVLSRPFGRWGMAAIVETQGRGRRMALRVGCVVGSEP